MLKVSMRHSLHVKNLKVNSSVVEEVVDSAYAPRCKVLGSDLAQVNHSVVHHLKMYLRDKDKEASCSSVGKCKSFYALATRLSSIHDIAQK